MMQSTMTVTSSFIFFGKSLTWKAACSIMKTTTLAGEETSGLAQTTQGGVMVNVNLVDLRRITKEQAVSTRRLGLTRPVRA